MPPVLVSLALLLGAALARHRSPLTSMISDYDPIHITSDALLSEHNRIRRSAGVGSIAGMCAGLARASSSDLYHGNSSIFDSHLMSGSELRGLQHQHEHDPVPLGVCDAQQHVRCGRQ
jgi:hypothetical protein